MGFMASSSTTPISRAQASISSTSRALLAMGFSHSTCFPARIIAMDCAQWA